MIPAIILAGLVAVVAFWYVSAKVHERALEAARAMCQAEHWQLLDESVSLKKLGLGRGSDGRVHFRRQYQFAYTEDQGSRCEKTLVMLGSDPVYKTETSGNVIRFPTTRK